MKRRDKENYYLDIAEVVLERSTCIRRHYGAIIVKERRGDLDRLRPRRAGERIAVISVTATGKKIIFRAGHGMRCVAVSTRRRTRSLALRGTR